MSLTCSRTRGSRAESAGIGSGRGGCASSSDTGAQITTDPLKNCDFHLRFTKLCLVTCSETVIILANLSQNSEQRRGMSEQL